MNLSENISNITSATYYLRVGNKRRSQPSKPAAAIKTRRNQQTLQPLEKVVQYDLEHFNYPDAIWEALLNRICQVITEQRHTKKCA